MTQFPKRLFFSLMMLLLFGCGKENTSVSPGSTIPIGSSPAPTVIIPGSTKDTILDESSSDDDENDDDEDEVVLLPDPEEDVFQAKALQTQDFLFVVDNSSSMDFERAKVMAALNDFVEKMEARRTVNYQVAVTTIDAETHQGALMQSSGGYQVVNRDTPNALGEFQTLFDVADSVRSHIEQGLRSAELAIRSYGDLFLRDETPLSIIIISDAPDQSCQRNLAGNLCFKLPISYFKTFFEGLTDTQGDKRVTELYPISAKLGDECSGLEGADQADWAADGGRYPDLVTSMGVGAFGSVCENHIENSLETVANRVAERGICYPLSQTPDVQTLAVSVDGTAVPASDLQGYRYDSTQRSICFSGNYQPSEGSQITVQYRLPSP